jgi:glycosyltransferase involved in cell wall biosynthesis
MRQTYPAIEHIVVDGGSTDGTHEILAAYESRYNLSWSSASDSGMYQAINRGFALARGDVLAYLNSDDLYLPWTVETVVNRLMSDPGVDVVYGDALLVDEVTRQARIVFQPPFSKVLLLRTGFLVQPTVFWRRIAYEAVDGFQEHLRFVGDLEFFIRMSNRYRFAKVDEILAVERRHVAAKTSASIVDVLSEARHVRSRYDRVGWIKRRTSGIRERVRGWLWRRMYWARFVLAWQGLTPRTHWNRFIDGAAPQVSVARVGLVQIPLLGWRFAQDAVVPSPGWIDALMGSHEST